MWFGAGLWAWLHLPVAGCSHAVVLCPPMGYEAWCSYQTFRALADRLVAQGIGALRLDYAGTGSSAGSYEDPGQVAAWIASVRAAVGELRRRGVARVSLVGLRFGGLLATYAAIAEGDEPALDHLIVWDPVLSGKRFARELRAFALAGGTADAGGIEDGRLGVSGTIYTTETAAAIATLDPTTAPAPRAQRALVLERPDRPVPTCLTDRWRAAGVEVALAAAEGLPELLETDNENARVPEATLDAIVAALAVAPSEPAAVERGGATSIALTCEGAAIRETAHVIGPHALFAIHGAPAEDPHTHLVIMLGGGVEHQVGPGRVWVEFARALNARGIATLRADVDGVGDSGIRGPRSVVRSYDPEHVLDIGELAAFGRALEYRKVIVLGLCSGGWLAVQGGLRYPLDGVFALNPQLFWQWGMEVYSTMVETHEKQRVMRAREVEGDLDGRWDYLDELGFKSQAMTWLETLVARGVRTHIAYGEGDEGYESLLARNRGSLAKLLASSPLLTLEELTGIDHGMHRFRRRPEVLARIEAFVRAL